MRVGQKKLIITGCLIAIFLSACTPEKKDVEPTPTPSPSVTSETSHEIKLPKLEDLAVDVQEDVSTTFQVTASDPDGKTISLTITSAPLHGSVTLLSGSLGFTYTPVANYNGSDSFKLIANNGSLGSRVATISVNVIPVNDAPVALGQNVNATEDQLKTN